MHYRFSPEQFKCTSRAVVGVFRTLDGLRSAFPSLWNIASYVIVEHLKAGVKSKKICLTEEASGWESMDKKVIVGAEPVRQSASQSVLARAMGRLKAMPPSAPGVCGYLNQPIIRHMKAIRYAPQLSPTFFRSLLKPSPLWPGGKIQRVY